MWLEINLFDFNVKHNGFIENKFENRILYVSPSLGCLRSVRDLIVSERGIAIEIDAVNRRVLFGRDYLGQYPLLFLHINNKLFLTDDMLHVDNWVAQNNIRLTLSEESLALYFSLGYVPQGMTLYDEITSCKNVTIYHFKLNKISEENVFQPIEEIAGHHINEVEKCISEEASKLIKQHSHFDVWCSGGIDSSIMAYCFTRNQSKADILTLGYDDETKAKFGDGEIQYAREIAEHCQSPLRYAQLSPDSFVRLHKQFTEGHISPVIDTCVIAKYALASATHHTAITGEGGDPVFGGVKNTNVIFTLAQHPRLSHGWVYAHAHCRFFDRLNEIFINGKDLSDYVIEYLEKKIALYPGGILRKLFYLNTIEKQGGMIFPQSYYPEKRYGISAHHPLTNLSVYRSAFQLNDNQRYIYPDGKLVLSGLFKNKIPKTIIKRKKSGTVIPLKSFVENMPATYADIENLGGAGFFNEAILPQMSPLNESESQLLIYSFVTLNQWMLNRKGGHHV